jgi:hypothetical protein
MSHFDCPENFLMHTAKAVSLYTMVRENCSETKLPHFYAISGSNLASIYSDRKFARSEEEYYANLENGLRLQNSALQLISKTDEPIEWGILQHNIGHSYTDFFKMQTDKHLSMIVIDKAIHHLELSFQVRDSTDMLQYWIASCRSLGEALIERSMHQPNPQAAIDLRSSYDLLSGAASKISETEHPNQWAEIQKQLARCADQRLRLTSQEFPPEMV